ncbi:MAG: ABC transporter ATP-binding protein [Micropepsaceae bacterium]
MMLELREVTSGYGPIEVLHEISLKVNEGEIATLIGANGAGKTTLLMTICGAPRARAGQILFDGDDITNIPMHELVHRGIAHVPEGRHIFPRMSVLENLQMGANASKLKFFSDDLEFVFTLFPRLKDRLNQRGGTLSGGEQQMLAIGRGLMSRPRLLLLDEPSLGLAPLIVRQVFDTIRAVNAERNLTILLIEQNAYQALKLADNAYVLVSGTITLSGTGSELLGNKEVQAAYIEGGGATTH